MGVHVHHHRHAVVKRAGRDKRGVTGDVRSGTADSTE